MAQLLSLESMLHVNPLSDSACSPEYAIHLARASAFPLVDTLHLNVNKPGIAVL
jgi:hypothetical protein